ncbi:D-alanyl-D-alanine carboxypeptidase [Streptomyces sp. NEAU-H22]|uniref:D-alanyl-D-alanine carboxypeptidase n=1 Tax=Streptomyces sp. NEAU-H22 TaxID=2994655 RepID=UPI00225565C3|nr:D-alanyl-D-alanine carboxypeptidase [Streptomyces sp. NEAU-H22]MCX3286770.1 D-alanyl-D-alanine carboxypeptidase [Streptomyces sp. NEAU-H22]
MAGESPDRSKQRESSARRTSGSASPVPEARSEAADPRLAVARDAERSSARGGADTATRVLSTRTAQDPKNTGRATGDSEPEDEAGRGAGDSDTESTAGDAGRTAGAADAEGPESDSGTEGAADAADGAAGDAGRAGSGSDTEDAAGDAREGVPGASEESGASGADEEASDTKGSDGRLRDAVAAWVASADEGEKPAAAKEDAEGAENGRGAAERTDESTEAGTDGKEVAGKPAGAPEDRSDAKGADNDADRPAEDADNDADEADDTDGTGRREAERDEAAQDAAGEADEPEADRSATGGSAADTETADKTANKPSKPADPRVSSDAKAAPKAPEAKDSAPKTPDDAAEDDVAEGRARTEGPAKDEPGGDKTSKPAGVTGSTSKSDKSDGPADDDAPAERPVDQPTAVFKTLRPPVDQPTTMLKLGGAAKDLPKSDLPKTETPKTDAPKKDVPEKDAERTSKFVALKPLDDPATKKPVAPAEATAPVPTVGPERTTQQPLPPKPPLDLLAELTNTPPPPETPLRTAARRVKIWTPLVLLLVVVFAVVQSVRPLPAPTLELTAKDSYTFEGGKVDIPWPADGQAALDVQGIGTFGSSGEQKPVPIASVAKVMTAYVILRDHPLKSGQDGPKILIDQAAQDQSDAGQESTVDVTKGDKITEREALESILIASANNVARLLARWDAGSEKAFVQKMNDAAKDLGMKNTTYTDPSGLNNTTVSTAVDQVKLAKAAMLQPAFREVATMMSYVDYKQKKHDNWNRLVGYNNVTGIKTGTTTSALGNLVFSARKDVNGEVHRIIGAVVRQPAGGPDNTILGAALHEGDKLIRAAQGALESATILKKGDVVGYADDGLGGRTPVAVTEDVTAVGWAGLSVKLTFAGDDLPHTAEAGTKVGTLTVGDGTTSAVKVPVALQKDLAEPGFAAKLTRLG